MQQLRSAIHNAIARFLKNQPPARIIAVGFALLILLGAALLMLPFAVHPGAHVGPLDALFTATSAVCVTGLVVVDTGDTFSLFGQAVIAILIQIGGLGVASIGMGLALVAGRRISLKGRSLVREAHATRVNAEKGEALSQAFPEGVYEPLGRTFVLNPIAPKHEHYIAVVTAGTSDIPVAEEAAVTAETFGNHVKRIYDVGVAGIHRLFNRLEDIQGASVVIVIAGMEGALVSVVGGLVDVPVIAVPTSIGYGTNLQGVTTLLSMLTSCASGVTVVNIDNGFGAAYSASMINNIRGGLA